MPKPFSDKMIGFGLLLFSLLNLLPIVVFPATGDILFQQQMIECFVMQFWQGDLYPRWCFTANAELGSPIFLFYLPLPLYLFAVLDPALQWVAGSYAVYVAGVWCAILFTLWTLFYWLKDIVSERVALLAAGFAVFIPYHMELISSRVAYAELWGMAFLPLLFKYSRDIARGKHHAATAYGITLAALWLTHIPISIAGTIFSVLYVAFLSPKALRYTFAGATLSLFLSAFYLIPVFHYHAFISGESLYTGVRGLANDFLHIPTTADGIKKPVTLSILSIAVLSYASLRLFHRRNAIPYLGGKKEFEAWLAIFIGAVFLLLPLSKPLYDLTYPFSSAALPWRMQCLFVPYAGYLAAVYGQYLISNRSRKTWKGDYICAVVFLLLLDILSHGTMDARYAETVEQLQRAQFVFATQYRSRWSDESFTNWQTILDVQKTNPAKITPVKGAGKIQLHRWAWDGITFSTESKEPLQLKLRHFYFPIWRAEDENGQRLTLHPEEKTGWMLLDAPAGKHSIALNYAAGNDIPAMSMVSGWVSALSVLGIGFYFYRRRAIS
jgi:hypothetical protein